MDAKTHTDYLIIGAGPAGIQLGYFLEKAGRDYVILEAGDSPGTFFKTFPRHRKLISINKVYTGYENPELNLRWDWNSLLSDREALRFKHYDGCYFPNSDVLVRYLSDFANHYRLKIKFGTKVARISKKTQFMVLDEAGHQYSCRCLIIATGFTKPYIPPIPGVELAEPYGIVSLDPKEFVNQRVLIIGKGNSGFETAENLIETAAAIHLVSPHSLRMAWQSHFVGDLRAVNNNFLDTYQLKSQNAVLDAVVEKIERGAGRFAVMVRYAHANGEVETLFYDRVILCTGFRFDSAIFDSDCRPALVVNDRFPEQTSSWESTNVPQLYFAGTLMQMRDYGKTTSGFIHGFRYNIRALHRLCEETYHRVPWPSHPSRLTPTDLRDVVIRRVNESSALWQQFGFLCDLIAVSRPDGKAHYYEELPVDYVHDGAFGRHDDYYTITLEYGPDHGRHDPFHFERIERNDSDHAHLSNFLHPVIRHFAGSRLLAEHHVIEDLAAEWLEDIHTRPLLDFFNQELFKRV